MPLARATGGVADATGPDQWFKSLPFITRHWFLATILMTCAGNFKLLHPAYLVYSWDQIKGKFEIWRVFTCFCYAGGFSFGTLIVLFSLVQFSKQYESGFPFNTGAGGGTADYAFALLFGMIGILVSYPITLMIVPMPPIFCRNLVFFVLYVWSKRNPTAAANLWGVPMAAIYLPFAYLVLSIFMGDPGYDIIQGIFIGHLYYFLVDVYPSVYGKDVLRTPQFLIDYFGLGVYEEGRGGEAGGWSAPAAGPAAAAGAGAGAAATGSGRHNWGGSGQTLGRQ